MSIHHGMAGEGVDMEGPAPGCRSAFGDGDGSWWDQFVVDRAPLKSSLESTVAF